MTTVPHDWLVCRVTVEEVEEQVSSDGAPDSWLEQWQAFRSHVGPRDELWRYYAILEGDSVPADRVDLNDMRVGFALVREGEVVETIPESPWS
jgi:hypothetical protein